MLLVKKYIFTWTYSVVVFSFFFNFNSSYLQNAVWLAQCCLFQCVFYFCCFSYCSPVKRMVQVTNSIKLVAGDTYFILHGVCVHKSLENYQSLPVSDTVATYQSFRLTQSLLQWHLYHSVNRQVRIRTDFTLSFTTHNEHSPSMIWFQSRKSWNWPRTLSPVPACASSAPQTWARPPAAVPVRSRNSLQHSEFCHRHRQYRAKSKMRQ